MLVDINNTTELERKATETSEAFGKFIGQIEDGLAAKQARLDDDLETRLARTNADDRPTLRKMLQRDVEQTMAEARRDVVTASAEQREAMVAQLQDAELQLNVIESLNKGPQQVLARLHSGDPEKATYLQTLSLGGPGALQTHAELAKATGDRALASAVLIVNDNLKTNARPFSSAEFAETMVGEEVNAVQTKIARLRFKISSAKQLNTAFTRGTSNPVDKISRGIQQRGLAA